MKYSPEPIEEENHLRHKYTVKWTVDFDDKGYEFDNQNDAMMFCLLLEIRDLLRESNRTKILKEDLGRGD